MIEPYYQQDGITLYCGDCRDILPQFPDKSFDLVLTDPPYGVGYDYDKHDDKMSQEELKSWMRPIFLNMRRVSKTVLISTGQKSLPIYAGIEYWKWLLAWWKPAAMGRSPVGFCNFEPMAMWGEGTSSSVDVVKAEIIPDKSINGHPCPKPLDWGRGFISIFPNANTILDPFCGSGTTLVAAKQLGRKAVGIEISEKYCKIAVDRLRQMELFNENK